MLANVKKMVNRRESNPMTTQMEMVINEMSIAFLVCSVIDASRPQDSLQRFSHHLSHMKLFFTLVFKALPTVSHFQHAYILYCFQVIF